jgi:hypothetical protein
VGSKKIKKGIKDVYTKNMSRVLADVEGWRV